MRPYLIPAAALIASLGALAPAHAQNVVTYHNTYWRHGGYVVPGLTTAAAATLTLDSSFTGAVTGQVYAQPLYYEPGGGKPNLVLVFTETNQVTALNATTGAVVWQQNGLPQANQNGNAPCGDISPEGITGTPVIDPVAKVVYFDAVIATGAAHKIYALSLADGSIVSGWPIDVATGVTALGGAFANAAQGQRGAALFLNGALYIGFGGKAGDCGSYHGTVVEVAPATHKIAAYWSTTANGGGIWSQASLSSDGKFIYASTGNTIGASAWSRGEAIIRLTAGLANHSNTADYFAPADWQTLDGEDLDLGGTGGMPLSVHLTAAKTVPRLIEFGKDGNAYLMNRSNLGGIGGELNVTPASKTQIKTAPVTYTLGATTMVAFFSQSGIECSGRSVTAIAVAGSGTAPLTTKWCTPVTSNDTAPIVTTSDAAGDNPIIWVVDAEGDNVLHALNASTGAILYSGPAMTGLHHFQTLIAAGGHLYVAADNRVYAYSFTPG